jgi:DNA polymerase I-like protein with 3'-5' exonuclease and polymerase domains
VEAATQILKPLILANLDPPMNITLVTRDSGLEALRGFIDRERAKPRPEVGLDTETNYTHDFWSRRIRTIQIGNREEQYVIDLLSFAGSKAALIDSQGEWGKNKAEIYKPVLDILEPVVGTNKFLKLGQNLNFEYEVFHWNLGVKIWHLYSMDMAERVIAAGEHPLKVYSWFSMEEIFARYFGYQIDKSEQENFDLETPLTPEQLRYAAFDVRAPFSVRDKQMQILYCDALQATNQIEQDALGSYTDMHLYGMTMDTAAWMKNLETAKANHIEYLKEMDAAFIPVVGRKDSQIDEAKLARLEKKWREGFQETTQAEIDLAADRRAEKDPAKKLALSINLKTLECTRKQAKAEARKKFQEYNSVKSAWSKKLPKCIGEAYINYSSNDQMLEALKKLHFKLKDMQDDSLLEFNDHQLIKTIRKFKKGDKLIGTYGEQWARRWVTKPCKEEGFLHPMDGKLHPVFNQLEAETGRSSSSKPSVMNLPKQQEVRSCFVADPVPDGTPEEDENVIVTVDMSGAELRILAELANAQTWIRAFKLGQDVHAVGAELLYPDKWPLIGLKDCAYFRMKEDGTLAKKKCKCPEHQELRDGNKATNFMIVYGGGPPALADELDITMERAKELLNSHRRINADLWAYLDRSGKSALEKREARDMYGRRRKLPHPTPESAAEWLKSEYPEKMELPEDQQEASIKIFMEKELRKPTKEERYLLTHHRPDFKQIQWAMRALYASRERQGKNHCIQGTNASIIKRAMGCGMDKDGKGYLWHLLPQFDARLLSMVHDELIIQCKRKVAQQVALCVADAFRRAAAEVMHQVEMTAEFHIAAHWQK